MSQQHFNAWMQRLPTLTSRDHQTKTNNWTRSGHRPNSEPHSRIRSNETGTRRNEAESPCEQLRMPDLHRTGRQRDSNGPGLRTRRLPKVRDLLDGRVGSPRQPWLSLPDLQSAFDTSPVILNLFPPFYYYCCFLVSISALEWRNESRDDSQLARGWCNFSFFLLFCFIIICFSAVHSFLLNIFSFIF